MSPILEANQAHLGPWIPARVANPAPVDELAQRLTGFTNDFNADREWRFGMFTRDEHKLLGEVGLFPRSATGRVPFPDSDRVELGYWLRSDETGRGFVTEAARAALDMATTLGRFAHAEIRCDERNTPSAAVPQRLGFTLSTTLEEPGNPPVHLQVWTSPLPLVY